MKTYVEYTTKALKDLQKLNQLTARKIVKKIRFYSEQQSPLKFAKKLKPPFDDLYCFRVGEYRAIFERDIKGAITLLVILKVAHRREVYG